MVFKILNKNLYSCDIWGNVIRKISENVLFGTWDDSTSNFLVTKEDGKVELKDLNGNIIRVLAYDAIEARFQSSNDIIVRKKDGRTLIVDKWGNVKRYI